MRASDLLFGYFSPETLLPATSIVATIAGIVMMLGQRSLRLFVFAIRRARAGSMRTAATSRPHFPVGEEVTAQTPRD